MRALAAGVERQKRERARPGRIHTSPAATQARQLQVSTASERQSTPAMLEEFLCAVVIQECEPLPCRHPSPAAHAGTRLATPSLRTLASAAASLQPWPATPCSCMCRFWRSYCDREWNAPLQQLMVLPCDMGCSTGLLKLSACSSLTLLLPGMLATIQQAPHSPDIPQHELAVIWGARGLWWAGQAEGPACLHRLAVHTGKAPRLLYCWGCRHC